MSMWSSSCRLIGIRVERDDFGVETEREHPRRVQCNVFSVSDAAYYAAATVGIHPEAVLQLRKAAYQGERLVEFEGRRLSVERVDRSSADFVRLTLSEAVGDRG